MRFPPVDLGTGPWSKRTVASQIENFGPMSGAHRPRGSIGEVSLDNADAVIDGATFAIRGGMHPRQSCAGLLRVARRKLPVRPRCNASVEPDRRQYPPRENVHQIPSRSASSLAWPHRKD